MHSQKPQQINNSPVYYVKLQDAYVAETGAYYGSFTKIGYEVPGKQTDVLGQTSNFKYEQKGTYVAGTASLGDDAATVWQATNLLKLNDCAGDAANWQLAVTGGSSGQYSWSTHMGPSCDALTPNFANLGTSTF